MAGRKVGSTANQKFEKLQQFLKKENDLHAQPNRCSTKDIRHEPQTNKELRIRGEK